jgi:HPt (histidine-containing phosphotransfer) domain-containing protein
VWYDIAVLLDLTEVEKGALLDLLVAGIARGEPSRRTDLLHRVLAKLGTDTIAEPLDPLSPLDEIVLEALRELQRDRTPNLLGMLVSLFRENVPGILKELAVAAEGTDPERLLTLAHKLRGISTNVGARGKSRRLAPLESRGSNSRSFARGRARKTETLRRTVLFLLSRSYTHQYRA